MTQSSGFLATLEARALSTFVLEQHVRYRYSAPVTDLHQYLKVVPPPRHGAQRRRSWHLEVSGVAESHTRAFRDTFGNMTFAITTPRIEGEIEFAVRVEADADTTDRSPRIAADRRYGRSTLLTTADAAITELALAGRRDATSLCERAHRSLSYQWGITGVRTTAAEALAGGLGVCQDYAHIMLAACRAVGVPARYVSGHLIGEGGSHAWVEVLHRDPSRPGSWVAEGWDPTHNRRTDASYLTVGVGRDYFDAAPLSGWFTGEGVTATLAVDKRLSA